MFRRRSTLVWIHRDGCARAQLSSDGKLDAAAPEGFERLARAPGSTLGEAVLDALPERITGTVWVLTDEIIGQTIELDAQQVRGLADEDLGQALAYEAQMLTGLAAAESELAWQALPSDGGQRSFRIAALAKGELADLDLAVRERGGRLGGLAHCAGLPRPVHASTGGVWRRRESWPGLEAELAGEADGTVRLALRRVDPTRRRRDGDIAPADEVLVAPGAPPIPDALDARRIDLAVDADLSAWLAAWAEELAVRPGTLPLLTAGARPIAVRLRAALAVGIALVALAACWFHHTGLRQLRDALRGEAVLAAQPAERVRVLESELTRLDQELARIEAEAPPPLPPPDPCAWTPDRPLRWLRAIAEHRPAGLSIQEIDFARERSTLRGVCVEPQLAEELGAALTRTFAADGCAVETRSKRLVAAPGGGRVYEFELGLRGEAPPAAVPTAAPSAASGEVPGGTR